MYIAGIVLFFNVVLPYFWWKTRDSYTDFVYVVCLLYHISWLLKFSKKFGSQLQILGTRWVTWCRFRIEVSQILGTKFCCLGLLVPEFCASLPCLLKYKMIPLHSPTTSGKYMYKTCLILHAIVWQPPHFQMVHYKKFLSLMFRKCGNFSFVSLTCF